MAGANFVKLAVVLGFCVAEIYGNGAREIGTGDARFGIPVASTQVVNNMTVNPSDLATQFMQSLPGIKLGILSSTATFLAPVLQGLLVTSLILFALTGTAAVICQMIDCSAAIGGFNNNAGHSSGFVAATHVAPLAGFHQHQFNSNPTGIPFPRRRQGMLQKKPWLNVPQLQPPMPAVSVEDPLD